MHSGRVWVLALSELDIAGFHAFLAISVREAPSIWLRLSLLVCWPRQDLNSSSFLKRSFNASVSTVAGEELMNSAYFSSLSFTSSSTRIWMVADLGCLGGALSSGKYSSPFCLQIVRLRV